MGIQNHEVIRIANIIFYFEFMLHELVKLIHIDVDEELGGEITQRKASPTNTIIILIMVVFV